MLLDAIGGRGAIFVGGKGGVGKTTVAAMLAVTLAERGERVRLVSTDPAHNLGHLFDRTVGDGPTTLGAGLLAHELDPERTVAAHLAEIESFLREIMPRESHAEITRHLDRSSHAPGMAEAALLDRLCDMTESVGRDVDRLIVDTAPTGHTLALLSLPEMMAAWTEGLLKNRAEADRFAAKARQLAGGAPEPDRNARIRGVLSRRRERLGRLRNRLSDPQRTAFVIATIPERMPVLETLALSRTLARAHIAVPAIVVNRISRSEPSVVEDRLAPIRAALPQTPVIALPDRGREPTGWADLASLYEALARC